MERGKVKSRAYIGNLRSNPDLQTKLLYLFHEHEFNTIQESDIVIHTQSSCYALVSYNSVERLISRLNGFEFDGRRLVVQREKRKQGQKKPSFGGGWAGPSQTSPRRQYVNPAKQTQVEPLSGAGNTVAIKVEDEENRDEMTMEDFKSRCQKPLAELLTEFGEYDPDFQKIVPVEAPPKEMAQNSSLEGENRLGQHGKASIHVEFTSFGYFHGAPPSQGWSHAHPLPPIDCRALATVPHHMQRQDGYSPMVRKILLTDELGNFVGNFVSQVLGALAEASMDGHGPALPLRMTVHVGSDMGRHRSVLVCEEAAKRLRRRLRSNAGNLIPWEVSVGTLHKDIQRTTTNRKDLQPSPKQKHWELTEE
jgi:hypothetical protein